MRLALAIAVYGALVGLARVLHRRVIYQPPSDPPGALPEGATLIEAKAADGASVVALDFPPIPPAPEPPAAHRGFPKAPPPPPPPSRAIVHFHGNAETVDDDTGIARE